MHCLPCAMGYCKCFSDVYTHLRMAGMDVGCETWLDCAECGRPSRSNQGLANISSLFIYGYDMGAHMAAHILSPACICRLHFFFLCRSTLLNPGRHRRCSPSCGGAREAVGLKSEQTSNLRVRSFSCVPGMWFASRRAKANLAQRPCAISDCHSLGLPSPTWSGKREG